MEIRYYLTIFPMEAMIASHLSPEAFAAYMAVGNRKGSAEHLMFFEVDGTGIENTFDLDYARRRCVKHSDGRLKNSVYLSVYRALEAAPLKALGTLRLVNRDGRVLGLERGEYSDPEPWSGTALYQELCPATPLVVSGLNPKHFAEYIVEDSSKVTMPSIVFADLMMPSLDGRDFTGNVGGYYDKMMEHLGHCVSDLRAGKGKMSKVVDRSAGGVFNYQVIGRGIYIGARRGALAFYPMPGRDELKKSHYDWGKSAMIF